MSDSTIAHLLADDEAFEPCPSCRGEAYQESSRRHRDGFADILTCSRCAGFGWIIVQRPQESEKP